MPPRMAPGPTRSRGRGGGPPSRGPAQPQQAQPNPGVPILPAAHITTVGVKRQKPGTNGRAMSVFVNAFVTSIPESKIYHYDGLSFSLLFLSPLIPIFTQLVCEYTTLSSGSNPYQSHLTLREDPPRTSQHGTYRTVANRNRTSDFLSSRGI